MGKKNNKNRSRTQGGSMPDLLNAAGWSVSEHEKEKTERDKNERSGHGNYKGNSQRKDRDNYNRKSGNIVHELPVDEGPHAPYNFVPISPVVLEDPQKGKYNVITDDTYSGEICYHVTAKTPILVDDGNNEFYQNKDKVYAIPGSTMRGLIRNNAQILGLSNVMEDIDDYNLMYRAVAGGCLKNEYGYVLGQGTQSINGQQMTVLKNVKAGYISCERGKYFLYSNIGDRPGSGESFSGGTDYYVVNERYVLENAKSDFEDIVDDFQNALPFTKYKDRNGRIHYKGSEPSKPYVPYSSPSPISYKLSNGRVCGISKENKYKHYGYVIFSGKMQEKKAFYVIPAIDKNTKREIPKDAITAYQIDYNRKLKTIPEEARSFYKLPEDGKTKPVFYIELDGKLYFGYTPRLRLMYEHSIHDGLDQNAVPQDFARSIFGFTDEGKKDSRKSKVFFPDAVLNGEGRIEEAIELILGEPNPTSYLEYLDQKDGQEVATYNSKNFHIRGIKQYWLHKGITDGMTSDKENVKSTLCPLKAGCSFDGKIRFQNLSKEELGLLIWSIVLEEDSLMNVGKAKAYGYGQIKIDGVELSLLNPKGCYMADSVAFTVSPFEKQTKEQMMEFVNTYKQFASDQIGRDIMQDDSIRDFFAMKSESNLLDGRTVEYMPLEEPKDKKENIDHKKEKQKDKGYKEYKQGNNPLPTVQDICDNKKKKQRE